MTASLANFPLFFGDSVTAAVPMTALNVGDLWQRVRNDETLKNEVERLRKVKAMDAAAYTRLKVRLPYFCCGNFKGGARRAEHFVAIQAMTLDIDHYANDVAALEALKERLAQDERVAMLFRSPGGDGVKVLFVLDKPCNDTKTFSDAYKSFAFRFAEEYGIMKFMDFRTIDATRVCFLSHDPLAYMNPMATAVQWEAFVPSMALPVDNSIPFLADAPMASEAGNNSALAAAASMAKSAERVAVVENRSHNIAPDVYADILRKLQTKARTNPMKREVAQPERLQLVLAPIGLAMSEQGISVAAVKDIQYGKQLRLTCGAHSAELNIFYGKRGFSVVEVVRNVHQAALSLLCVFIAEQTIYKEFSEDGKA